MTDDHAQCILQNQIEIMGALSLLLRYAKPDLIGKAGELDRQRGDLLQRHKVSERALAVPNEKPFYGAECPSYPNCSGGCGLGCTHNIEARRRTMALTNGDR